MAVSPDGKVLASASDDNTIRLRETASGKEIRVLLGHDASAHVLVFAPDGKILASASADKTIRLWETATGKEIRAFEGHVYALAFSPAGKVLASASADKTIRLWETASGKEIRAIQGHQDSIRSVVFSPDGRTLASASADTTVLIWAVSGRTAVPATLAAERLPDLWAQLADADVTRAHDALWALTAAPRQALPFLEQHLKPDPPADARRLAALIADLESDQFAVRQKATQELEKLGDTAVPALRQKSKEIAALETRQRLERLLEKLDGPVPSAAQLRIIRAVQVLEYTGDREARMLLNNLAQGLPATRLTREAKAALERLAKAGTGE
jgi:hypothetical protein